MILSRNVTKTKTNIKTLFTAIGSGKPASALQKMHQGSQEQEDEGAALQESPRGWRGQLAVPRTLCRGSSGAERSHLPALACLVAGLNIEKSAQRSHRAHPR